jgi:hypothetical protein
LGKEFVSQARRETVLQNLRGFHFGTHERRAKARRFYADAVLAIRA